MVLVQNKSKQAIPSLINGVQGTQAFVTRAEDASCAVASSLPMSGPRMCTVGLQTLPSPEAARHTMSTPHMCSGQTIKNKLRTTIAENHSGIPPIKSKRAAPHKIA